MNQWELILQRLENQIENMLDTLIELEKFEQAEPIRELSNWHKTTLSMLFTSQVLTKSMWYMLKDKWLTQEEKEKYIIEVAELTREHYKQLYWYDTLETANNS